MSLTLSEAQSIVSNALDDPNNDYVTLAQLTNWINEGCLDIARRSQTLQQMATIPVIALQNIYTMPTNLLSVHRMEYIPSGQIYPNQQIYPLVYRAINDMDQVWGVNQGSQSTYPNSLLLGLILLTSRSNSFQSPLNQGHSMFGTIAPPLQ